MDKLGLEWRFLPADDAPFQVQNRVIDGVMCSGKTAMLARTYKRCLQAELDVIALTDARCAKRNTKGALVVRSRNGNEVPTLVFHQDANLYNDVIASLTFDGGIILLVDEMQFLTHDHIRQIGKLLDEGHVTTVQFFGLSGDFMGKPFPNTTAIGELAERLQAERTTLTTKCQGCGNIATISARIVDGKVAKDGEVLGINDKYYPLCTDCFDEG